MKILLANYRYFLSGGPERYMFNLISELEDKQHRIIPFSVDYSANEATPYSKYFVQPLGTREEVYFDQQKMTPQTLVRTLSRLFYSKEVEKSVIRLIDDTQPKVAYILHYLKKISPSLLVALKKRQIPILVRLSDYAMLCPQNHCIRDNQPCTLCIQGNIQSSIYHNCVKNSRPASILNALATWFHQYKGYFNLIDTFVTTNEFMYNLMQKAGWPSDKLVCIPTFTNTRVFSPTTTNLNSDYICYAGRLDHIKGIEVLLRAFSKMKNRRAGLLLKIAGTGSADFLNMLNASTKALGIAGDVQFVGKLGTRALSKFLSHARLTVVPSLWFENLPNAILESFACGTPVLASDIGSLPMCVTPGVTGDLFTPGDDDDLAEKADFYLDQTRLLDQMSLNARAEAISRYSPESHIAKLEKAMNRLV